VRHSIVRLAEEWLRGSSKVFLSTFRSPHQLVSRSFVPTHTATGLAAHALLFQLLVSGLRQNV
jgi:hypothetical protein